ncbi:class II aldolase and Adducin N-terminal domain protein [Aspergillus ambiguus]|uniref:class II aldolase and Adducin N-terminal domain protein n=1 Tax=Aspergillus ambiguus TaxID=176160 RepID=UPI003CCCAC52
MSTTTTKTIEVPAVATASTASASQNLAVATGGYVFPGIPEVTDPLKKRQWQLEHMAGAFRVFARKGFTEGTSGHISVRDPVDPNTFWINPMGKHFGMLRACDMVHINEDGQVIGGNRVAINAAGFIIHSAIHRARPDINAACHMHTPNGKAWSAFGRPIDIINQDSCNFYGTQAVYGDFGGVAIGEEEGQKIVDALGEKGRVIFLQNHGLLTTGGTVDEAAYLFTCLERTCEVQLKVEAAGLPKKFISQKAAEFTAATNADPETLYTEFQPDFEFEIWKSRGELCKGD